MKHTKGTLRGWVGETSLLLNGSDCYPGSTKRISKRDRERENHSLSERRLKDPLLQFQGPFANLFDNLESKSERRNVKEPF